jgi:amidase
MAVAPVQANGIIHEMLIEGTASGPLAGLKFAVKDIFDVEGTITGAGNPDWLKTHSPAHSTARAVQMLLAAGATLVGKTLMDEMAFSLDGVNVHYGSAVNPEYASCITGGSSSGSAAAVASACVDFALGTDTGGSVRVPACYCGIYGMRPTHGRIPIAGVMPLAPEFDTVGWFAREARILEECGLVLLHEKLDGKTVEPKKILVAKEGFEIVSPNIKHEMEKALNLLAVNFGQTETVSLDELGFDEFPKYFRILQGWQAWQCHGAWIQSCQPEFGQAIKERFLFASQVSESEFLRARSFMQDLRGKLNYLLAEEDLLCLPTAWDRPHAKTATQAEFLLHRTQNMKLTTLAPLTGAPQVSVPVRSVGQACLGLSFLAKPNNDAFLLRFCRELNLFEEKERP